MPQRRFSLMGLLMALAMGCAAPRPVPPEANIYHAKQFAFSAVIPSGWQVQRAETAYARNEMRIKLPPDFEGLRLTDAASGGEIWVLGSLVDIDWNAPSDSADCRIRECVSALVDAMRNKLTPAPQNFKRHDAGIEATRRDWRRAPSGFKPTSLASIDFGTVAAANHSRTHLELLVYPCFGNRTCILMAVRYSPRDHLEANQAAFEAFLASIRVHDG